METVLYRKYRPHSFADVIGQEHIVGVLEKTAEAANPAGGKTPGIAPAHAYLFSGSRGTGKTSIARIFAKALGATPNDIYEIDAASNRGIDDAKAIRDGVNVLPLESRWKVYIIDEVHMLTREAWNALLKTLEEPPAHAIFILATTELEKVPETIISRCQVFSFKKPSAEALAKTVSGVAKKEGAGLEPAAAELIALIGDGSFRDALGTLQKVLAAQGSGAIKSGGKGSVKSAANISQADVEAVTGAPKSALVRDFVAGLAEKNASKSLSALHTAVAENVDMALFTTLVLNLTRAVVLARIGGSSSVGESTLTKNLSAEDTAFVKSHSQSAGTSGGSSNTAGISSKTVLELLAAAIALRTSPIPELPLELAVINLSAAEK
jgi:DNA polymerase-3 subunit gamma/tau